MLSPPPEIRIRIVIRKLHMECALDNSVSRFSPDIVLEAIKNGGHSLAAGQKPGPLELQCLSPLQRLNGPTPFFYTLLAR